MGLSVVLTSAIVMQVCEPSSQDVYERQQEKHLQSYIEEFGGKQY